MFVETLLAMKNSPLEAAIIGTCEPLHPSRMVDSSDVQV
jgi:hypothetical protein